MSKKQVIVMRTDLKNQQGHKIRTGKLIAQGAHASMKAILDTGFVDGTYSEHNPEGDKFFNIPLTDNVYEWLTSNFKKIAVKAPNEQTLFDVVEQAKALKIPFALILDSGLTEFGGVPTYTCCAIGPADDQLIDSITRGFDLL